MSLKVIINDYSLFEKKLLFDRAYYEWIRADFNRMWSSLSKP